MIKIGDRNEELTKRAKKFKAVNTPRDIALVKIAEINWSECEVLLPAEEVVIIIKSIYRT